MEQVPFLYKVCSCTEEKFVIELRGGGSLVPCRYTHTHSHTPAHRLRDQPLMRFLCCPQKIFGAEMRSVPPGDLSLGNGDASPGPGLPPQLLHLHHVQQDAHHRGPLWHEGQSGVLSAAL